MFVVCGEALFDVFMDKEAAMDATSLSFTARVGGSPLNVAVGLSRLGRESALLTGVSTDFFGDRLQAVLRAEGVSTDLLSRKSGPTTLGFVQKSEEGIPSYAFYGNGAADRALESSDLDFDRSATRCIHLGSYSIVVPSTSNTLLELVKAESQNCVISLDPNIRPTVEPDIAKWRASVEKLLPYVDVLKASDEDLGILYPGRSLEDVLQSWVESGVKLVALTRGPDGATLISKEGRADVTAPVTQVIDTVGAGDTFQAALLDQVIALNEEYGDRWPEKMTSKTMADIGRFAAGAASITCSRQGAELPRRAEVLQLLKSWS